MEVKQRIAVFTLNYKRFRDMKLQPLCDYRYIKDEYDINCLFTKVIIDKDFYLDRDKNKSYDVLLENQPEIDHIDTSYL